MKLQAVSFQDIKKKQFISTCSTILPGNPRKTKHLDEVSHPKVAEFYLTNFTLILLFSFNFTWQLLTSTITSGQDQWDYRMQYSQNLHTLGSLMAYLVFFSLMHIWPIDILSQISPVWSMLTSKRHYQISW